MTGSNRYRQRAARHSEKARHYRRQARLLLERDQDRDCAAIAEFARKA